MRTNPDLIYESQLEYRDYRDVLWHHAFSATQLTTYNFPYATTTAISHETRKLICSPNFVVSGCSCRNWLGDE